MSIVPVQTPTRFGDTVDIKITTVPEVGAVHDHQTEPVAPLVIQEYSGLLSPVSRVAPASEPARVAVEPVTTVRLSKLSLGGAWANELRTEASASKRQIMKIPLGIFIA